jgi:hypothetical protein
VNLAIFKALSALNHCACLPALSNDLVGTKVASSHIVDADCDWSFSAGALCIDKRAQQCQPSSSRSRFLVLDFAQGLLPFDPKPKTTLRQYEGLINIPNVINLKEISAAVGIRFRGSRGIGSCFKL